MSESPNTEHVLGRARRAAEQFRAHCRVLGLMSPLLASTAEHEELVTLSKKVEVGFNALVLLEGRRLEDALSKLESGVSQLEQQLQALDARIPMGWFRQHFDPSQASSVALADYATLLGYHAGVDPTRLDRIQFILTRLVSFFISAEDDSPTRRRQLLAEALPPSTLAGSTREAVVAFCNDAIRRLGTFASLKDLIDSGFFVDVRGYKLSLREQQLDPDVMAAVIELNEATSAALDRLAEVEQAQAQARGQQPGKGEEQGKALEAHMAEVDLRIKAIFKALRVDESDQTQKFEAWLKGSAAARAAGAKPRPGDEYMALRFSPRQDKRLILGAITLVLFVVMIFRFPLPQSLHTLTPTECLELSPLVVSGAAAPEHAPKLFVGYIDKSAWALMDAAARREAAVKLAGAIATRGWIAGTVMLEEQVVIQIENGNVLVVQ